MAKILLGSLRRFDFTLFYQSEATIHVLLARVMRRRVIVYMGGSGFKTLHAGGLQDKLLSLPLLIGERLMSILAHKIILVTPQIAVSASLSKIFVAPTRLFDKEFFSTYQMTKKLAERETTVGYVGRFVPEKGVERLVDAFSYVVTRLPGVRLLLIGDGPSRLKIEAKIFKYGLEKSVLITSWVNNVELYLNKVKLLVLPSSTEGLPNVLLEAMACGTPVLAPPVGAIPDIIKEGETGFLLKSNDPKHIAERIIELLNKPDLLEKVSVNAYNYVRENFNFEKTLDAWRKILLEL
jgi:glycosyltransferase involved in cell wall biosynthesis